MDNIKVIKYTPNPILSSSLYAMVGSFTKGKMFEPIMIDNVCNLYDYFGETKIGKTSMAVYLYFQPYDFRIHSSISTNIIAMRIPSRPTIKDYLKSYKILAESEFEINQIIFPELKYTSIKTIRKIVNYIDNNFTYKDPLLILDIGC